jgi:hypothetical protein
MKLIRSSRKTFTFGLDEGEKMLLLEVIQLYPLVPPSHHRLSKGSQSALRPEDDQLLEEALAEQRRDNRKQILEMLEQPEKFRKLKNGALRISLTPAEIESLLQMLNDVRVGAWMALGQPEEINLVEADSENGLFVLSLQVADHFQASLLAALGIEEKKEWRAE